MSRLASVHAARLAGLMLLASLAGCETGGARQPTPGPNPGPSRTHPIPDTINPNGPGPQGTLPNPYVNPE